MTEPTLVSKSARALFEETTRQRGGYRGVTFNHLIHFVSGVLCMTVTTICSFPTNAILKIPVDKKVTSFNENSTCNLRDNLKPKTII